MPKVTGRRPAGRGGNGRKLTPADNKGPELSPEQLAIKAADEKRKREEAEGIQLLSIMGRAKAQQAKVETARAALKVEQDGLNDIFRAAKLQSKDFTRERLQELIKDTAPGSRRDVQSNEETRARFRRILGLPVGLSDTERELESRLPDVERNGTFYRSAGYTDGLSGNAHTLPPGCVDGGFGNLYDAGYTDGQAALHEANQAAKVKPKAAAPAAPPAEETELQRKRREKAEERAVTDGLAKLGDVPLAEVNKALGDMVPLARLKAMLANDPANDELGLQVADREAAGEKADPDEVTLLTEEIAAAKGDGFEASPEELAAQAGRPSVVAERTQAEIDAEAGGETV